MYRELGKVDDREAPPKELVYPLVPRGRGSSMALQMFAMPPVLAVVLTLLLDRWAGLGGLVAGIVYIAIQSRRGPPKLVFTVEDRALVVRRGRKEMVRAPLSELTNVSLDTTSIRPVQEGNSAIPAMRFIEARVGPEIDVARIMIVRRGQSDFALTADRGSHLEASEWLGKIRVFLRKHGWLPEDEAPNLEPDEEGT